MESDTRVTTRELANKLLISRDTLRRWIKKGKIPEPNKDKLGYFYWDIHEIYKFIKESEDIKTTRGE